MRIPVHIFGIIYIEERLKNGGFITLHKAILDHEGRHHIVCGAYERYGREYKVVDDPENKVVCYHCCQGLGWVQDKEVKSQ